MTHPFHMPGLIPRSASALITPGYLGPIRRHIVDGYTVALWQLDGDMTDATGNGYTLHVATNAETSPSGANYPVGGVELYADMYPNFRGFYFNGTTFLIRGTHDAALAIVGDMTVEMLLLPYVFPTTSMTNSAPVVCFDGGLGDSAHNTLWDITYTDNGVFWYYRHGAGTVVSYQVTNRAHRDIVHFALSRHGGNAFLYLNGVNLGSQAVSPPPDGGGSSQLIFGSANVAFPCPNCIVASVRVSNIGRTDNEMRATFNQTLGPAFGAM